MIIESYIIPLRFRKLRVDTSGLVTPANMEDKPSDYLDLFVHVCMDV